MKTWAMFLLGSCSLAQSLQLMDGPAAAHASTLAWDLERRVVPPAEQLASIWKSKFDNDQEENLKPLPESVQLMLGLMSTQATEPGVFKAHRTTWMNRTGVCAASHGRQPGCTVYVAFVFGDAKGSERAAAPDELFLNGTENMDEGKTFSFFHYAARAYPWTTHIGKMDLDTFPHVHNLTTELEGHLHRENSENCGAFFGMPVDWRSCGMFEHCPPRGCGYPYPVEGNFSEGNFRHFRGRSPECWGYLQGGFYLISSALARGATDEGGNWSRNRTGPEDMKTGWAVSQYAKLNHACVDTWDSVGAFDHHGYERNHRVHRVGGRPRRG